MIRVVQICTSSSRGGAAIVAKQIHDDLIASNEFESTFLTRDSDSSFRTILSVTNFRIKGNDDFFLDKAYWARLLRKDYFSDKIVHFHNTHGYFLPLKLIERISAQAKKVVVTLHDLWWATGRCAYPPQECTLHREGCNNCPHLDIYPKTYFRKNFSNDYLFKKKFLKENNITLTAPSQSMVADLSDRLGFSYPVEVIYNGVNVKPLQIEKKRDTLVSGLDSISHHKGSDLALKMLEDATFDDEFDILVKDQRIFNIKNYKCKINLIESPKTHIEFYQLLEQYRYIVIPSRFETFGLLALEACILGVRPILNELEVFKEVLRDYPIYSNDLYESWKNRILKKNKFVLQNKFYISEMLTNYKEIYKRKDNKNV